MATHDAPAREVLPQRRISTAVSFDHDGLMYRACFSRLADGSIGEMFMDAGKTGTSANIIAKECAVIFSLARQYHVPLTVLMDALPRLYDGSPAGPIGKALQLITTGE